MKTVDARLGNLLASRLATGVDLFGGATSADFDVAYLEGLDPSVGKRLLDGNPLRRI